MIFVSEASRLFEEFPHLKKIYWATFWQPTKTGQFKVKSRLCPTLVVDIFGHFFSAALIPQNMTSITKCFNYFANTL
jgi:hypothetical protein